jgi:hypothetical protein
MTEQIDAIVQAKLIQLQKRALDLWKGHERQAVIEIVRSADHTALLN